MRALALASAGLVLASCSSFRLNPHDPRTPDTVAGRAQADHQRGLAETLCGPQGTVSQRDDTDGTRSSDWNCERRKP
jgi:hypothetical protein